MQAHLRLYRNGEIYETCAVNAFKECYCVNTQLISIEHQVVDDRAEVYGNIFHIKLNVTESDMTFLLHMPIQQSEAWETIVLDDIYTLGFYCNLGELTNDGAI